MQYQNLLVAIINKRNFKPKQKFINAMKKSIITITAGIVLGAVIMGFAMYKAAPGMMLLEDEAKYDFVEATEKFEAAIKAQGWSTVAVHDLQKSMKKHNHDVKAVKVYEICHPDLANRILSTSDDRVVASLMPCRVAIYEKHDGKTYYSRMNSGLMAKTMSHLVDEVMADASAQSEVIMKSIAQ